MAFTYQPYKEADYVANARAKANEYATYREGQRVTDAYNQLQSHNNNKVAEWTGGNYGQSVQDALDKINNRQKFTYDLNSDVLYQQAKDKYVALGKMAMQDTMAQAAQLTGGYGNSYAATAGNQAYQNYLTSLNDIVPDLYAQARDQYNEEGNQLQQNFANMKAMQDTEYGQYRDTVADWENERAFLQNQYENERNMDYQKFTDDRTYYTNQYNDYRDFDYGLYQDTRDFDERLYEIDQDQQRWQAEFNQAKAEADRNYQLALAEYELSKQKLVSGGKTQTQSITSKKPDDKFFASIRTKNEFNRSGYRNGQEVQNDDKIAYGNYNDYVKAMAAKFELSPEELKWIEENY